jgi:hypothetical protein
MCCAEPRGRPILCQSSCGSNDAVAAADTKIRPTKAYSDRPMCMVAMPASFTNDTSTPSMKTSSMPQGSRWLTQDRAVRNAGSRRPRRTPRSTYRQLAIISAGPSTLVITTTTASSPMPALYRAVEAPIRVVISSRPWMSRVRKGKRLANRNRMAADR